MLFLVHMRMPLVLLSQRTKGFNRQGKMKLVDWFTEG